MNSIPLVELLIPYGIGLGGSLIYYFLFVSSEFLVEQPTPFALQLVFLLGSLAVHTVAAVVCYWGMNPVLAIASSFETNSVVSIVMAMICLISSLFLFGIIQVAPVRMRTPEGGSDNLKSTLQQLRDLFWTPHLLWIGVNALVVAVYFVQISDSVIAVFAGMFSTFLFWWKLVHKA